MKSTLDTRGQRNVTLLWYTASDSHLLAYSKLRSTILEILPNHPLTIKPYHSPCHPLKNVSFSASTPKPGYSMVLSILFEKIKKDTHYYLVVKIIH